MKCYKRDDYTVCFPLSFFKDGLKRGDKIYLTECKVIGKDKAISTNKKFILTVNGLERRKGI